MPETTTRERAPRMSPERRRAAIVAAAIPLVTRHGSGVLTADIAAAAGIAEGTIFGVFPDKEALLGACLASVADTRDVHARLTAILDVGIADAVEQAIDVVLTHLATAMPVVMRVTTTGPTPKAARGLRAQLTDATTASSPSCSRRTPTSSGCRSRRQPGSCTCSCSGRQCSRNRRPRPCSPGRSCQG